MSRQSAEHYENKRSKSAAERRLERQAALTDVLKGRYSNLWGNLYREENFPTSLTIRHKDGKFLAILSRGDAGSREVAFGTGYDWIDALDELNNTLARDAWKDSKFQD